MLAELRANLDLTNLTGSARTVKANWVKTKETNRNHKFRFFASDLAL
jgi:hypothetical protein